MKKVAFALVMVCLLSTMAQGSSLPGMGQLPFKEGVVSYSLEGMVEGENIVYIKDSGATSAAYRTEVTKMMGLVDKLNELTITTPDWIYTIDLDDKSGEKQMNPQKYVSEKFSLLSASEKKKFTKNSEELGITFIGGMSGDVEKRAKKVKGYMCDKVTLMGLEAYVLSNTNFPMGISGKIMGMGMKETVTSINLQSVDDGKFEIPQGVQLEHERMGDTAIKEQIDLMFVSVLAGEKPRGPQQEYMEEGGEDMEGAVGAMKSMDSNDPGMQEIQKQMMRLMEKSEAAN